jgi:hypothetical protein
MKAISQFFCLAALMMLAQEEVPMKFRKVSLFVALLIAVSLTGVAQSQIRINVPFDFSVGGKVMPAGDYRVARVDSRDPMVWRLSNEHGTVVVLTNPVDSPTRAHPPSLVFLNTGDRLFLVQIWDAEHSGQGLLLKPKVTTVILAKGAKYVEIGAE